MLKIVETQACTPRAHNLTSGIASAYGEVALGDLSKLQTSGNAVNPQNQIWFRYIGDRSYKKLKNVSCEYDRVNGWNSTLQAAWYIRHVRIIWFLWTKRTVWLLILSFTQNRFKKRKEKIDLDYYRYVGFVWVGLLAVFDWVDETNYLLFGATVNYFGCFFRRRCRTPRFFPFFFDRSTLYYLVCTWSRLKGASTAAVLHYDRQQHIFPF